MLLSVYHYFGSNKVIKLLCRFGHFLHGPVYSLRSGGRKPEIQVPAGLSLLPKLEGLAMISLPLPASVAPGAPWLVATSLPSLPPLPRGFHLCGSVSVSFRFLLQGTPVVGFRNHPKSRTISSGDLQLIHIYQDHVSKQGPILAKVPGHRDIF